jgi:hypothetical protein
MSLSSSPSFARLQRGDDGITRERRLIEEIDQKLPEFVQACKAQDADFVLMHQDSFAPMLGNDGMFLSVKPSSAPG